MSVKKKIKVGESIVIHSDSPKTTFSVVFEDDGETGYLYALDSRKKDNPIVDALPLYNVKDVVDKEVPLGISISWSDDGSKVTLLINDYAHASFDFETQKGRCRLRKDLIPIKADGTKHDRVPR